jgi:hypothetical protein
LAVINEGLVVELTLMVQPLVAVAVTFETPNATTSVAVIGPERTGSAVAALAMFNV